MPNNNDKEKTRKYRVNDTRRRKPVPRKDASRTRNARRPEARKNIDRNRRNGQKTRKDKKMSKHPKLMIAIKVCVIIFLLLCVVGAGIVAGMFFRVIWR